jgi:putative ATP-binding cassette transporter
MMKDFSAFTGDLWALTRPYWFSSERLSALTLLVAIMAMNFGMIYLSIVLNDWHRLFFNALQNHNYPEYIHQFTRFCELATIHIVVAVYRVYLNQMLQIRWRHWLTGRYLDDWLAGKAYYRLQLSSGETDNPDQRIAEDVRSFIGLTLSLTLGFINTLVTLFSFCVILWGLSGSLTLPWGQDGLAIPGYMVWVALIYAVGGTWLNHLVGRPLARLNFEQQHYEADFRFSLMRLRENAEGVALYGGEGQESRGLSERFSRIVGNWWDIMRCQKRLNWFTSGYDQLAIVFPFVVAAPRYFAGSLQLGDLMQTSSAFGQVQGALSWFIGAYVALAEWRAAVRRLTSFRAAMVAAHAAAAHDATSPEAGIARTAGDDASLHVDDLTLALPHRSAPLLQTGLAFAPGEAVLISGRSGSGKSTLFRALAGIWPYGRGRIRLPRDARLLFLPQKPYLPIGPLRAAVAYPAPAERFSDTALRDALSACGVGALADDLDRIDHWGQCLSPGEQQRMAIARALLNQPDWLFLDEATSACDPETEASLYGVLRDRLSGTTVISIGHRASLYPFHQRRLLVTPDAGGIGRLIPIPA